MAKKKLYTVTLTLPDGRRKWYRGVTKKAAEEKRAADKELLGLGINVSENPTFKEVAERWYYLLKEDTLQTKSKEIMRGMLERNIYPVLGNLPIRSIKPANICYLMKTISGMSRSTNQKVVQYIKAIFAFAMDNDLIVKSPVLSTIKAGGVPTKEAEALTDQQCVALLQSVKGTRAYLFVLLLLYTGLRKGEALGLMWRDIDFEEARLRVERSIVHPESNPAGEINPNLKTANARRVIPIAPPLLEELKAAKQKSKSLYVFSMRGGSFLSRDSFRKMWGLVAKGNLGFKVHPHLLRHTCITRWVENGLDLKAVQYLAGHSSTDITMNIYAHYRKDQLLATTAEQLAKIAIG